MHAFEALHTLPLVAAPQLASAKQATHAPAVASVDVQ
jgi:hypothetical protein